MDGEISGSGSCILYVYSETSLGFIGRQLVELKVVGNSHLARFNRSSGSRSRGCGVSVFLFKSNVDGNISFSPFAYGLGSGLCLLGGSAPCLQVHLLCAISSCWALCLWLCLRSSFRSQLQSGVGESWAKDLFKWGIFFWYCGVGLWLWGPSFPSSYQGFNLSLLESFSAFKVYS